MKGKPSAFLALLAAALLLGVVYLWQSWESGRTLNALREVARSPDLDALLDASGQELTGAVDQAMRGISLSRGEGGREIWTLDAAHGVFRQESGRADLRELSIRYAVGAADGEAPPDYAHARSDRGSVEDGNRLMTMEGGVFASLRDQTLAGPRATFRSDTRVLEMPEGGVFTDAGLTGEGKVLRWNLSDNILEGERGVKIVWTPSPASSPVPDETRRTPSPAQPDGDAR